MTKVKVTREVAEAIESAKLIRSEEVIVGMSISKSFVGEQAVLNNIDTYIIAKMLLNGYEVEKTPEDKIRSYYDDAIRQSQEAAYPDGKSIAIGRITAIRQTLSYLGIKYEGVNA